MLYQYKMNKLLFLLFILKCGVIQSENVREGRVVGGYEAEPNSNPHIVSLQLRLLWVRVHFCGGSLLTNSWIVTAAHCIQESWIIRWLPMDAVAGAHDIDYYGPKVQLAAISQRIAHPNYKGGIGAHDIAVLKTETPFTLTKEIQPIRLPAKGFNYRNIDSLYLSGWGALRTTVFWPAMPSKLQEVSVAYLPYGKCYDAIENIKSYYEANPLNRYSNICTGPISGGISACNGDSGGPLIYYMPNENKINKTQATTTKMNKKTTTKATTVAETEEYDVIVDATFFEDDVIENYKNNNSSNKKPLQSRNNSTAVLLGIVSWGVSPCGDAGAPSVYTKVETYVNFLRNYIRN